MLPAKNVASNKLHVWTGAQPKTVSAKKYKSHSSNVLQPKSGDGLESTSSACHRSTVYQRLQKQTWQVLATGYEHLKQLLLRLSTCKYKYK